MTRFLSTLRLDLTLQVRYGFYYASAFLVVLWVVLLGSVSATDLMRVLPLVIFIELDLVGFYFIAGMILFEKGERTLQAIVVTPIRFREYLVSKLATFTLMSLIVALIIVLIVYGTGFNAALLLAGVLLASLLGLTVGFITVSPFNAISSFTMASQIPLLLLASPLLDYFGLVQSPLFYLIPSRGALLLLEGAFNPAAIEGWQVMYALVYQSLWIAVLGYVAYRAFNRYMIERQGA